MIRVANVSLEYDTPAGKEAPSASMASVVARGVFADGFESGDTGAWSDVQP